MRIAYVTNARMPTEKAHGYQIARVCLELARIGHEVSLVVPRRHDPTAGDVFTYYDMKREFELSYIPCPNLMGLTRVLGWRAFAAQSQVFLLAAKRSGRVPANAAVLSRNVETAHVFRGQPVYFNAHDWPGDDSRHLRLLRRCAGIICNSPGTERAARARCAVPTTVASNATDPNPYVGSDKALLRNELGLPVGVPLAIYTGHLYTWKGSPTLIEAAALLSSGPVQIIAVGGLPQDIAACRALADERRLSNITFIGYRPRREMALYQAAADVLLLPNSSRDRESREFTSPLKLFEYMSSGNPIVASGLPSILATVDDRSAFIVPPDDPAALAQAIMDAVTNKAEAASRVRAALALASTNSWQRHAERLAEFMAANRRSRCAESLA